ncbi:hypothetical protein FRX31_013259 [Thalictrum thalictroides]|uniref:U-box domain-containing protein n=1 Tax=Thalictrum thalictroides TaxID=46969 RepID=A0A7J6WJP5_THATH|nr:hypothetical protein FRX31_013259 [Thalictrum thalictroides]
MAIGVQSHDFGVVDCLMGSTRGEIEEEIVRIPREVVVEEKLYVAVSKDVKDCKPTVLWVLKHFEGRKICLLHVHQPSQMIPMRSSNLSAIWESLELGRVEDRNEEFV